MTMLGPQKQRLFPKRCVLGLAILTASSLYLAYFMTHKSVLSPLTVPASIEPFSVTEGEMVSYTVMNRNLYNEQVSVAEEERFLVTTSATIATENTTKKAPSIRDILDAAAKQAKSVYIPSTFKYNNHIYFAMSETEHISAYSSFLINPSHICSTNGETGRGSPFLMVLVLSSYLPQAAKEREAIRVTYGSVTTGQQWPGGRPLVAPVTMVFLLGSPPTLKHRRLIELENAKFRDMLVADFVDSYQNLTLKVLHGLYWVLHNCPQVKFVLKADDDVFVNLPLLTSFLYMRGENNSLYGHAYFAAKVEREGRWAVSVQAYPVPLFPVYMSGTAYVMSIDAAQKILEASSKLPLIPVEDAFITGILSQITKVRRMKTAGFTHFSEEKPKMCDFVKDIRFIGNNMHACDKRGMWTSMKISGHHSCS